MTPLEEYISIIHSRQQNPLPEGQYGERHHIIPKSCGGCNKSWNLVKLTIAEHIRCHRLLVDIYPAGKEHLAMKTAWELMSIEKGGSCLTEEEMVEARISRLKSITGRNNPNYGKPLSEEHKQRLRIIHTGAHLSEETRQKISESNKGKHHRQAWNKGKTGVYSEETRRKMSAAQKGKPRPYLKTIVQSEETRRKRSESIKAWHLAHPMTEETKRKISETKLSRKLEERKAV